jgi:hypothetical protein
LPKKALKLRELLKRLKVYGVVPAGKRGKGSEIILIKENEKNRGRGPQYPMFGRLGRLYYAASLFI